MRIGGTLKVPVIAGTKILREVYQICIGITALHLKDKIATSHKTHCPESLNIGSQLLLHYWT